MLEIGGMPIIWHIMKNYSFYGYNDFVICAGYKQHVIKEWFADYFLHTSDVTFDYTKGNSRMIVHNKHVEPWKVTIVDTGLNTQTGISFPAEDGQIVSFVIETMTEEESDHNAMIRLMAASIMPAAMDPDAAE